MKTNKIVARIRVETEKPESEVLKPYLIEALAEQAAKVFEGLLKENPGLYDLTLTGENCKDGEFEFAMSVSINDKAARETIKIGEAAIKLDTLINAHYFE
jgi:hypothetical protein